MERNKIETSYLIAFSLLGIFPIVPFNLKPLLIAPLLVTSLVNLFGVNRALINWKKIVVSASIYGLFVASSLYTDDSDRALKLLSRLIPFFVFPIGFALVPNSMYKRLMDRFIKVYTICCSLLGLIIFAYCLSLHTTDINYLFSEISNNFWGFEDHPIYISLYFGIAIILLLLKSEKTILNIVNFAIILFALVFLSRKGNIISLIIALLPVLIFNAKKLANRKYWVYYFIGLLIVVGASFVFNDFMINRFKELLEFDQIAGTTNTSTGIRSIIWQTAVDLSAESPIFGHGLGSVQDLIDASFVRNGYGKLTLVLRYNAHNQYLQIALMSGYLGLLIFLSILVYIANKIKHVKYALCVFLYIALCFMFESLLERQNGVIITALFFNLFLFLPQQEKEAILEI